jgi:transposase
MDVINTRCCGLDVHKRTVVACVITPGPKRQPHKERRTFGTMTEDLVQLADWLEAQTVTHVGLESTGSYWKPVWNILEERASFTLVLANARHIQDVPRYRVARRTCATLSGSPTCCGTG